MKQSLAVLALLGVVSIQEARALNLNHRHHHKARHMKKDDDDKVEEKEGDHPPKEVSGYTQDMIREDIKKNFYEDHAFNVTDLSYNSGDKKPKEHNNGFTNAQIRSYSSKNASSLVQASYGPTPWQGETNYRDHFHGGVVLDGVKPSSHCWGNCNGSGSEKNDDFADMGAASGSAEQFWGFTRKSKIGSLNTFDTAPTGHPMGINVVQQRSFGNTTLSANVTRNATRNATRNTTLNATSSFAQASYGPTPWQAETNYRDHFHGGVTLDGIKPSSHSWGNGNGSGSEKNDDFADMGMASGSAQQFYDFTRKSKIGSLNTFDTAPTGHPMGINVAQQRSFGNATLSANATRNSTVNATTSFAQASYGPTPWQAETNYRDHFHGGVVLDGVKPSSHCWGNCNGSGSEKNDDFADMGAASSSPEQFWGFTRKSKIGSLNTFDTAPTGHPMGINVVQQRSFNRNKHHHKHHNKHHQRHLSHAQTGPNDYGTWWSNGNNAGSEKTDTFWDMGHISQTPQEFDHRAARDVWLRSENEADAAPSGHNMGINVAQQRHRTGPNDYGTWWTDGNNGGSEKTDTFWDMGHISQTPQEFDHRASRDVWLRSQNEVDPSPSGHPAGINNIQTGYADYWKFLDYDSKDTEDFHDKASKPDLGSSNDNDKVPKTKYM